MQKNLLIVDDEPKIRKLYEQVFKSPEYIIQCAESAESAIETLKTFPASVFFLDLNLPGMNGVELCRKIHHEKPMAVLFAITGYASLFELSECREAGFEDYYIKPVRPSELREAAEHAFRKQARWKKR